MGEVYTSVNVTVVREKAFFFLSLFDLESISTIFFFFYISF